MNRIKSYGAVALVALLGVVACDRSGDADAPVAGAAEQGFMPQQEMDPEMLAAMMEMQQIQQKLEPIQRQALEDEALAGQLNALTSRIQVAMRDHDADLVDRIEGFQARVEAAETAGDDAAMQALMIEAQGLQSEAQALQVAVLERPDIKAEVEEFEAAHRARMIAIDPEAEALLDRIEELLAAFGE
jgi:hypothetical protein